MRVTLLTDASYCPKYGAAGWGARVACDRGKRSYGGTFKERLPSPSLAEFQAIVNGVYVSRRTGMLVPGDFLLIQVDCEAAIRYSEGRDLKTDELFRTKVQLDKLLEGVTHEFRHVKAHTSKGDDKYLANDLCDTIARGHMRRLRDQFIRNGEPTWKEIVKARSK